MRKITKNVIKLINFYDSSVSYFGIFKIAVAYVKDRGTLQETHICG